MSATPVTPLLERNSGPGPPGRPDLAALLVDQRLRCRRGKNLPVEFYLEQHPSLGADPESVLDLIFNEVILRGQRGEQPRLEDYLERFPHLAAQLRLQFEMEMLLHANGLLPSTPSLDTNTFSPESSLVQPASSVPKDIPGYEILAVLGRGGMGIVYKAWQVDLKRTVALKMILAENDTNPDLLARFKTEGEAIARLQHPNIVQVYHVGEEGGRPYLALEYVNGGGLEKCLDDVPQPPRLGAALLETLARAMQHAHAAGILHRDLKPSNVLLQYDKPVAGDLESDTCKLKAAIPKITDFGLAKIFIGGGGDTRTQSGAILGTPSYIAPELAEGNAQKVGPATDVYSLGAILYELLTGRPPFKGKTPLDTLRLVLSETPLPVSRHQPKVPHDLETICLHCLEKEPGKRYASALDLANDLRRFLEGTPIRARSVSLQERLWRSCRRNPVIASLAGLAVLLLVVIAVGAAVSSLVLASRLERAEMAERGVEEKLFEALVEKARAIRSSKRSGQRFDGLQAVMAAGQIVRSLDLGEEAVDRLRTEAIGCLALPDLAVGPVWEGRPPGILNFVFDDALERYARRDRSGAISIRRVTDDSEIRRLPGPGPGHELFVLSFSPDGQFLAATYAPGHILKVWHMEEPDPILTGLRDVFQVDFSPTSRLLACNDGNGLITVFDVPSGQSRHLHPGGTNFGSLAFHPKGRTLALAAQRAGRHVVLVCDVDSGDVVAELSPHSQPVSRIDWHPDGAALAAGCRDGRIYLWDVPARKTTAVLDARFFVSSIAWNRTGDLLASNSWDSVLRLWDTASGQQLFSMPSGADARFSHDGRRLAGYLHGTSTGILRVADGREYRTLASATTAKGKPRYHDAAVHPDGRVLAVAMNDGVRLWDLPSGRELCVLPTGATASVLFQPSGDLLTSGSKTGTQLWPMRPVAKLPGHYLIGPPEQLLTGATERLAQTRDGRTVAITPDFDGALLLKLEQPRVRGPLLVHNDASYVALSPEGDWLATCASQHGTGIKLWSALDRQPPHELPIDGGGKAAFSSDGRWLATATRSECRLWKPGSWEPGPRIAAFGGCMAFAPDSRLLAVAIDLATIALVDPDTGRAVATLKSPDQDRIGWLGFSPNGTSLLTTNNDSGSVHIWDLRRVREQLVPLGLDWDSKAYPPDEATTAGVNVLPQVVDK